MITLIFLWYYQNMLENSILAICLNFKKLQTISNKFLKYVGKRIFS